MLKPIFEAMPGELRALPRWVTHQAKCPYDPAAIRRKASVADPASWGSFQQAEAAYIEGGRDGVGFVLDGDGVVGIDLDHVVTDGRPDAAALVLLNRIGCQYIEISPSGTGLHGWGYGPNIGGRRGKLDGLHVELYSARRYLTCTGHVLQIGPLVQMPGFAAVADALRNVGSSLTPQKTTEVLLKPTDGHLLLSSVGCHATTPQREGQRNRCLFELARRAKARWPDATREERRSLVRQWHAAHYAVIGTKALTVSLDDFERSWNAVRHAPGEALASAMAGVDLHAPLPTHVRDMGYGPHDAMLWHICSALQAHAGEAPFFVSARIAATLMGHSDHSTAAAMLRAFVADGVLQLVSKGSGRYASRYRMVSPYE